MKPFGARRLFRFPSRTPVDLGEEIDAEFAFHLEMRTEDLVRAGLTAPEARAQARAEFGDVRAGAAASAPHVAAVERRRRLARLTNDLMQDLVYGMRLLRQSPGFATVAVLTLAVAIGGNTAIFTVINAVLLKPPAVGNPESLVRVHPGESQMAWANFADLRARASASAELAAYRAEARRIDARQGVPRDIGEAVTTNYFSVVRAQAALGRTIQPSDTRTDLVVLSERLWRLRFGSDPSILGRAIRLDRRTHEVIGIMPAAFRGMAPPGWRREFWIPVDRQSRDTLFTDRTIPAFQVIARLAGASRSEAEAALDSVAHQIRADHPAVPETFVSMRLFPIAGFEAFRGISGTMMPVFLFVGLLTVIAGLVLLIGCANIAGLLLGRAAARRREIAVRLALGAGRGRLVRQLLTESLVLALAGGAAGVCLALWTAGALNAMVAQLPLPMEFDLSLDWRVLAYAFGVSLGTILVFGLVPARRAARLALVPALKDDDAGALPRQRVRQVLVIGQVAVCSILLLWGILFARSLANVSGVAPGFEAVGVLTARVVFGEGTGFNRGQREAVFRQLQQRVETLPWVASVGAAWAVPLTLSSAERMGVFIDNEPMKGPGRRVVANRLTPGWFAAVRVPLLAGRDFTWQDRDGAPQVAVVNRTLADQFWKGDAVGKRMRFTGRRNVAHDLEVVGVVGDSKYWTLGETIEPAVYLPVHQADISDDLTLHVRTSNAAATADAISRELQRLTPGGLLETQSMTDAIAVAMLPARAGAAATGAFGALAALLAAIGIYGLVSFSVVQRTREIGIRRAIGAPTSQVVRLIVGGSVVLVIAGLTLGLALGVLGASALGGFIVGVSPADPLTLLAVSALVIAAALLSSALPALRAVRVDPLVALRKEA
jgi:predicted permease